MAPPGAVANLQRPAVERETAMVDNSNLVVGRIFFGLGFLLAILVMVRPFLVLRFLGDGVIEKVDRRWILAIQMIAVIVAAGAATQVIRSSLN